MRFWDDATYPEDWYEQDVPQVCAECGMDCGACDYDEVNRQCICWSCWRRGKVEPADEQTEVFARR